MPQPNILSSQEMAYLYDKYVNIARSAFGYLNGRVNRFNICILRPDHYSAQNYAEFRKPNIISIKIGSIINSAISFNQSESFIRGLIVLSIAHELSHADQSASMTRYGFDPVYRQYMEDSAECVSQTFLLRNMKTINTMFDTDIKSVISVYGRSYPSNLQIKTFDLLDHYATSIVDVLFRDYRLQKKIYDFFAFDNLVFDFDGFAIKLKKKGHLIDAVDQFNILLNQYRGITLNTAFNIRIKAKPVVTDKTNKLLVNFITSNMRYIPIIIPEDVND